MSFQTEIGFTKEEALKEANETLAKIKKDEISVDQRVTPKESIITDFAPIVNINLEQLQNQRSKQLAEILTQRLAIGMDVNYRNVTPKEASNILKNRTVKYNGEPGFYYAGTVYLVGDNISPRTVIHEFAHPLLQGLRMKNNKLFQNFMIKL